MSSSARAGRTPRPSWPRTPRSWSRSRTGCASRPGSGRHPNEARRLHPGRRGAHRPRLSLLAGLRCASTAPTRLARQCVGSRCGAPAKPTHPRSSRASRECRPPLRALVCAEPGLVPCGPIREGHGPQVRGPHLRVPDERARLRAHRRPARGRRHGAGGLADDADVVVLNTCCIRENADNKLYGNLGQLKRWKDAGGRRRRSARSSWPAAWPRRTARTGPPDGRRRSTSCSAPTTSTAAAELIDAGPSRRADHRDPGRGRGRRPRAVPLRAPGPAGRPGRARGSPSRSAATTRAPSASCPSVRGREISRPFADDRRPRSRRSPSRWRHRGHAARPERQQLRARPDAGGPPVWTSTGPGAAALRRAAASRRRRARASGGCATRRRTRRTSVPDTIAAMAETPTVCEHLHLPLQAGLGPGAGGDAPRLHRRPLPGEAGRRPARPCRPGRLHRSHRRLPGRDRRRLRAHARGRRRGGVRLRLHLHLQPPPGHRGRRPWWTHSSSRQRAAERFERLRVVVERSALARHRARIGRAEEVLVEGPSKKDPPCSPVAPARTSWCTSRPARPLRSGSYALVEVTGAAPHHLIRASCSRWLLEPLAQGAHPVAAG